MQSLRASVPGGTIDVPLPLLSLRPPPHGSLSCGHGWREQQSGGTHTWSPVGHAPGATVFTSSPWETGHAGLGTRGPRKHVHSLLASVPGDARRRAGSLQRLQADKARAADGLRATAGGWRRRGNRDAAQLSAGRAAARPFPGAGASLTQARPLEVNTPRPLAAFRPFQNRLHGKVCLIFRFGKKKKKSALPE